MKEGDSFPTHLNAFNTLMGQLLSMGINFTDDEKSNYFVVFIDGLLG